MPQSPRHRDHGSNSDPSIQFEADADGFHFRGSARPNLTFLYDSASRFEGIVGLADEPVATTMPYGLRVKDLIREVTGAATEIANAPLLSLQCPVQRPIDSKVEQGDRPVPPSTSLALRFAIALRKPSTELRIRLATRLLRYCAVRGYRLWLNDIRPGHRVGNWFIIRSHSGDDHSRSNGPWTADESDRIGYVLPVTFVGPARIGSTHAIISFLAQFPQIGVIGCAITSLDDLALVHLQLALGSPGLDRKLELPHELAFSRGNSPFGCLLKILRSLIRVEQKQMDTKLAAKMFAHAGDYQTLAGPLLPHLPVERERRMAIWFSWQMSRHDRGIATPIGRLTDAWSALYGRNDPTAGAAWSPTIEYLICRDVGNSVLRGKGKMSVPNRVLTDMFPIESVELPASRLCVGLEDAWKVQLDLDEDGPNVHAVTVAWREYWLGHWSALISQW